MPSFGGGAAPPVPPSVQNGPQQGPDLMTLAGMNGGGQGMGTPNGSSGMSQISETVVKMGAEIDQALKLLAQAMPQLAPWVEKTIMELRYQMGTALQSGAVPTSPVPNDNQQMPDGGGRI